MSDTLHTVGHWYLPQEEFLALLAQHNVTMVVDIRSFPGSKRSPQYGIEKMHSWLPEAGVSYTHLAKLGGRKRKVEVPDPLTNAGWQNDSFKNYADYTCTVDFAEGLSELESLASSEKIAYMCGEPMPWRCHRMILSDVLSARGWDVGHIMPNGAMTMHSPGMWGARPTIVDQAVTYPSEPGTKAEWSWQDGAVHV